MFVPGWLSLVTEAAQCLPHGLRGSEAFGLNTVRPAML